MDREVLIRSPRRGRPPPHRRLGVRTPAGIGAIEDLPHREITGRADVAAAEAAREEPLRRPAAEPADRYPTVEALANDVIRFRDGEPVEAYRETVVERGARIYRRYRVPILLVLAYMVMRVILLVWLRV